MSDLKTKVKHKLLVLQTRSRVANERDADEIISLCQPQWISVERELLSKALRALCLTRDYVQPALLPPIEGWEWFDAGKAIAEHIPDDEWSKQFWFRVKADQRASTEPPEESK